MSTPKVSIIVPIHNAGIFLYKCMDTLINQTLRDIEIICVLDCPTDGSDKIIEEYAKLDNRVTIIKNKQNLNIGLSRNEGLKIATGNYIGFSDHDDFRELKMYEDMYNKAIKNNADIVISNYADVSKNDTFFPTNYPIEEDDNVFNYRIFSCLIGADEDDSKSWISMIRNGCVWNKIYKRSFLLENKIQFEDNRYMSCEDLLFGIQVHSLSRKTVFCNQTYYYHCLHNFNTALSGKYYTYSFLKLYLDKLNLFLATNNKSQDFSRRYINSVCYFLILAITTELKFNGLKAALTLIRKIKKEINIKGATISFHQTVGRNRPIRFFKYMILKYILRQ